MNNDQLKIKNYQLTEGYKQTEVGVIPEDWDATTLGDVAEVIMGQSPKGSSYNRNGNGLPLINGPTEFTKKHPIKVQWTTEPTKLCRPLDLLLCVRGSSTGRMNIANDKFCIGRGVAAIRANARANTEYLTYQVHLAIEKLLALSAGSTFPNVDSKAIKSISLPSPGVEEQRSLAQALSDVDALIAALDKLIAKKRNLKTATVQQLLTGKKRLPGFGEGQGYKESVIGLIPKDWDVSAVGNICDFIVPGRNKPKIFKGNIPWITTPDLEDGRSVYTSKLGLFVSRDEAKSVGSKIIPSGAVIMSCVGELGIVAFVEREIVINQQLHAFIPSPIIDSIFLLNALQAQRDFMLSIATQTAVPYLNKHNCNSIPIPLPSCLEQHAIATVLSDMDAEIAALESRLAKTQAIKQGMMQELLTGRVRLKIET